MASNTQWKKVIKIGIFKTQDELFHCRHLGWKIGWDKEGWNWLWKADSLTTEQIILLS